MTRMFLLRLLGIAGATIGLTLAVTAGSASAQMALGGPYGPTTATESNPGSQIQVRPAQSGVWQASHAVPGSQIQDVGTSNSGSQIQTGGVGAQGGVSVAASCGFFVDRSDHHYVKYNHCGSASSIKIRVNLWYGWSSRDIWVGRYVTNLSTHWQLRGVGMITNAWCIERCW
ncbi:DUF6355 family natural product biosynthesis protein [Saccharothrix xinjiangensis]|uniref:DUF6355 family natural product biosynthesis protein n=1 Tax=Saccharothrix xinjiangensis TaxID=204798 RepID=A0ABV9XYG6_9PSEU